MRCVGVMAGLLALGVAEIALAQGIASEIPTDDWQLYARDHSGQRYVPLDQINRGNIAEVERAAEFRLRPEGRAAALAKPAPSMRAPARSASTIPISFTGSDGRQYISVMSTGSGFGPPQMGPDGPLNGESLITWALPEE